MAATAGIDVLDIRFPTSRELDGSDAMNPDPDHPAAYVVLRADDGPDGCGLAFTLGRGNDVQAAAIRALAPHVVGRPVPEDAAALAALSAELVGDSQLCRLGPEKGVVHLAVGAVVNAAWDLASRRAGLALWRFLAAMTPEELVGLVDFRHLSDALTPAEALELLRAGQEGRDERIALLERDAYPACTTSPGWLGHSDDKLAGLARQAVADGFVMIKLEVGGDLDDDACRMKPAREVVGPDGPHRGRRQPALGRRHGRRPDARTGALPAVLDRGADLAGRRPRPPGHRAGRGADQGRDRRARAEPRGVRATAPGGRARRPPARRVPGGGGNENVAILLPAKKFGVPVCPHAGGVGLCELVGHLSVFDYASVSGTMEDRVIEWVDHLHDHFLDPAVVRDGRYLAPALPGFSARLEDETLGDFRYPDGPVWAALGTEA
jgi:L-fuconate dehydratase